jgi:hypothetical protein
VETRSLICRIHRLRQLPEMEIEESGQLFSSQELSSRSQTVFAASSSHSMGDIAADEVLR